MTKSKFIEKKILEYYLNDIESAERVFEIRYWLKTWEKNWLNWFEEYIKYYLNQTWYELEEKNWGNKADWWIDIKWYYKGKKIYVQCKKYIQNFLDWENLDKIEKKWYVWLSQVRDFYWWVVSENDWCIKWCKILKDIKMIFITTWRFSNEAKTFAKKNNIILKDYREVAKITEDYSLWDFFSDFEKKYWANKLFKIKNFKFWNNENKDWNQLTIDDINKDDLYNFFKNIIPKLSEDFYIKDDLERIFKYWWLNKLNNKILVEYSEQINMWIKILKDQK